ncbi:SC5D oxidase, partial [Polypterus senegalus]
MDLILNIADYYILTPYVYPSTWPENGAFRQIISLLFITNLAAVMLYLMLGSVSYYFIFDHSLMKHPQFLENQVKREIKYALWSVPWISLPTVALFFAEVRGYSKLYDNIEDSPYDHSREIPPGCLDVTSGTEPMEVDVTSSSPFDVTSGCDPMIEDHMPDPYDLTSCLQL